MLGAMCNPCKETEALSRIFFHGAVVDFGLYHNILDTRLALALCDTARALLTVWKGYTELQCKPDLEHESCLGI